MANSHKKTIAVLTSGGDCAGLNAVIRAVVARAVDGYGWRVLGIKDGTMGLMQRPLQYLELDLNVCGGDMLRQGGTFLGTTNKGDPFAFPMPDGTKKDRSNELIEAVRELGIDAMIAIGGDGSLRIIRKLAQQGNIPLVAVPKTIDNDVHLTQSSVGFNTAVDVCVEALDRLQPTAASHHRIMILEVMGRDAGHIALHSGVAGGADVILIPEIPYTLEGVKAKLDRVKATGRNHGLMVVAEGVKTETGGPVTVAHSDQQVRYGGIGHYLSDKLANLVGAETRYTVLGHVQRGGTPSMRDRVLASAFGVHAVDLVAYERFDRMVAWQGRGVTDVPLAEVAGVTRSVSLDDPLLRSAQGLGIYVGEAKV
ncbi:MAG: ATP-dependent 6-phosphofructokinase [Alphaproteobacteria bacterium]|nr:ATP-dependent 6-phosphofructokinase [Alphaproteobacteria bacterium]